jgi:hypothetical protein
LMLRVEYSDSNEIPVCAQGRECDERFKGKYWETRVGGGAACSSGFPRRRPSGERCFSGATAR